jgi:micrococcal nuclease
MRCAFLAVVAWLGLSASPAGAWETCAREDGGSHEVVRVLDGETVVLDDGRELRLIGALAPKPDTLLTAPEAWPPARDAARALAASVLNRTVTLRGEGRRRDRYGRALAQLIVTGPNGPEWVQRRLIADGHARAYALPGNTACVGALIAAEADARAQRRGLWSRESYRVRSADDAKALLKLTGRFVVVEGRVASVARVQKTTYLNFGADWRTDFTARIATTLLEEGTGAAFSLDTLAGRAVRVRGWIERRNGPMITLSSRDEIEVTGEAAPAPLPPVGRSQGLGGIPNADVAGSPPP